MTDDLTSVYLTAHAGNNHPQCETCRGKGDTLEFLENDLVEFKYPNSNCPFCMTSLRLNRRFPMSQWKPLMDAEGFTLVSDAVKDHPERMRVVPQNKMRRSNR